MKKTILLTVLFALFTTLGFSQADKFWSSHRDAGKITVDKAAKREAFPKEFKLFDLNLASMRQELFKVVDNAAQHTTIITLPNADGQLEQFEVVEASNFEPALQARFPEIRAFSGRGLTDKYATLKLSYSPSGIQTMTFRVDRPNEFIEAYSQDHTVYAAFRSQAHANRIPWVCSTPEADMVTGLNARLHEDGSNFTGSSAGQLKVMRLAQSVTAEYSTFFGASTAGTAADIALVLTAVNATLTRCNGCYEKDLAVHLNLIANTTDVFFFNPNTDPYDPGSIGAGGSWNGQLQNTLTSIIGDANYDIGHLFGASGGGGNAGCIGCVCNSGTKGRGFTSPADGIPQGDNFDIDYVVHEVGHQLGATHTFTFQSEGGPLASSSQMEPGSGITIMGYAGITNQDDSAHSIAYYHAISINQIQNNLVTKSCPVTTVITPNNATPVVAPPAPFTVPITTPFALTGSATDANGADVLTYQWEQVDPSTTLTGNNSVASPTKASGPNWLSFNPTVSPTRLFPRLSTILAGLSVTPTLGGDAVANVEALSSVARTLNFRVTVRDNHPYSSTAPVAVAQTAYQDVAITVSSAVGPFLITSQNSAVTYAAGSTQTVTWSVNGTTGAPTNTSDVKISWSTDGGGTFTTLIASTPNDGTENIVIPGTATTTARIKVEAIGNIYFDINNANITVSAPVSDFSLGTPGTVTTACPVAANPTFTIPISTTGGFASAINFAATSGVPAGTTVSFVPNPATPPGQTSTVATLNNATTLTAGTYTITVTGTSGALSHTTTLTFIVSAGTPPVITTQPSNQTVCAPATATFTAASSTGGVTYQWQSAPTVSGTYTNIAGATSATYTTPATTAGMNGTAYHVVISTQCGSVTSNNAVLTVNTAAAITTQPTNQSGCTGGTVTFTVAASGSNLTYQWQSATAAGGPYSNVTTGTGGTTASYTTAAITGSTPGFYQVIVNSTSCPASVTSSVATLTIATTAAISTQPANQTVCAPATATFTVAATGTGLTYQWQSAPTIGGTYTNIAGATSASYTTPATTTAMDGTGYHVIVTGTCNTITSNNVSLTVNTAAAITTQPTAQTVCNGSTATFTVAATGTGVTYQWQSAPTIGGTYTNIAGATSASYTTPVLTPADNGKGYRVIVTTTTCAGTVTSTAVLLTVNTVATITTQPTNQSACVPASVTFTSAATGTGLSYQWQVSTAAVPAFTNIPGETNATLTINPTTVAMNGNQYRVQVSSTCSPGAPINSSAATLTVNNAVTVTQNPTAQSGCAGDNYTFSVTATGATLTYQWQVSTNGGGLYTNIAGATSATYTITAAPQSLSGNLYRVIVSGVPCGIVTTPGALLTLSIRPAVVLTPVVASTQNLPSNTSLFATVSPAGNYVYSWYLNGVLIPNTLASTSIPVTVSTGTYQVKVTDASTGCTSSSNTVTAESILNSLLTGSHLFVYPNPVSTTMEVRYYGADPATRNTTVNVYDSKGARVITKNFTITNTYGSMQVDMSRMIGGTYMVEVRDAAGKKLAEAKVVKNQ